MIINRYKIFFTIEDRKPGKAFVITFVMTFFLFVNAFAQRGNQSDWNVPPPLAPGSVTKGTTEGRSGNSGTATLTITDAPHVSLPEAVTQGMDIAPVSRVAPEVAAPQQPDVAANIGTADMPMPASPEAPSMPELTLKDTPVPSVVNIPMPQAPDLPPAPAQPIPGPLTGPVNTGNIPLTPSIAHQMVSFVAPPGLTGIWATPELPASINFKLIINKN